MKYRSKSKKRIKIKIVQRRIAGVYISNYDLAPTVQGYFFGEGWFN